MNTIRKPDGFESEKLFILPDYVLEQISGHNLIKDLFVTDIGFFPRARHHYRERMEGSESNIVIYCAEGEGWLEWHDGGPVPIKKHTVTVIPAGTPHRYGASEHDPWSIYWFHLKGDQTQEFIAYYGLGGQVLEVPFGSFLKFVELFDQCYNTIISKPYSIPHHIQISQSMRYLLSQIGLTASRSKQQERREDYLDRAIQYMTEHLEGTVSLADIAHYTGLSKQHLTHLFKMNVGYPPVDYFLRMKIQRASQMLDLTDLSVKQICSVFGFQDPYYFSRLFKKMMGCSPSAYRKIQKG